MANLIGPDGLETDAVVPQCLDNQYVSDTVFQDLIRRRVDFRDACVSKARERNFRTEFIRSLIYSSQVVVQRAYFRNSDFLYRNYLPEDGESLQAFAELMRSGAIVPYLFSETSLRDSLPFDVARQGDLATKALLQEVGDDVTCVRLATSDATNKRLTAAMSTAFGAGIGRLTYLRAPQRNAMASELFTDPTKLQAPGAWDAFNRSLSSLARHAAKTTDALSSDEFLSRTHLYRELFIEPNSNIADGRFRTPDSDQPFLFELKKFVDLVYNTNLPDHLHRYTFTPAMLPSRMALQDAPGVNYQHDQISSVVADGDTLDALRRMFVAGTQSAMGLPLLASLTMPDVLAIRALPEWQPFKEAQAAILREPLRCIELLPSFHESFDQFQRALSDWYNRTYERERTVGQYASHVSLALDVAGSLIVAGSHLEGLHHAAADFAIRGVAHVIPARVKGYAAKLMVGVYDLGKHRLDADRTYSVELMQTDEELLRDDVLELLAAINRRDDAAVPGATGVVADQGIR